MTKERVAKSTVTTVPATEVRQHFGEMLRRVHTGREQLVVEKDGLPIAAIMSHAEFEEYRRLKALGSLQLLGRAVGRDLEAEGISEEQALADLEATKQEVFAEKYGRPDKTRRRKST
jgi:prevent-host-death family protein